MAQGSEGAAEETVSFSNGDPGEGSESSGQPAAETKDTSEPEGEGAEAEEVDAEAEALAESDDEAAPDLFDEGEDEDPEIPDDGKPVPHDVHVQRIQALIGQRNRWKAEADDLREQVTELERDQAAVPELVQELWGHLEDPVATARQDALSMSFLEKHKGHPAVAPVVKLIKELIETGKEPRMTAAQPAATPAPEKPRTDPTVERIVRREAQREAEGVIKAGKLDPVVGRLIATHIGKTWDPREEVSAASVTKAIRTYLKENGLGKEVLSSAKQEERKTPPTGRRAGSARTAAPAKPAAKAEERPKRTAQEAESDRATRFSGLLDQAIAAQS